MFELIRPNSNFDFVGKRKLWLTLSVVTIVATLILFFTKGLNYGIDFTGGAEVQIRVPQQWDITRVRSQMDEAGLKNVKVQEMGDPVAKLFLIKAQGDEKSLNQVSQTVESALKKTLQPQEFEIQRVDVVGPAAGSTLRMSGFLSMFYAILCILIYVSVRFDFRYSPGAVLALFHDSVITLGIFIVTQKQFDLQVLAAILALIGYSNNDTIIVYDRVRETALLNPKLSIVEVVNRSINETLGRTILTSLTTFLTVFSLWMFGGKVIEDFAFTLMIGLVVGVYSSIFIASSVVIYLTEYQLKKAGRMSSASHTQKKKITVRPEPKLQE